MKKLNLKNKKGFTLVELLAVIVVLAIIILIAMPSVLSSMEKARKNSFAVEANEVIRSAQTAYADAVMQGKSGNTFCISYAYLKKGFLEKNDGSYHGSVKLEIDPSTGTTTYTLWLSNNNYIITNKQPDITTEKVDPKSSNDASDNCGGLTDQNAVILKP